MVKKHGGIGEMVQCLRELAALSEDNAPTWLLTAVCNTSFVKFKALSGFFRHCIHVVLRHRQSTHTHKAKENNKEVK